MLEVSIVGEEFFDEDKQIFIPLKSQTFQLEHSLVSIARWESKWQKPFLAKQEKTTDEILDYIRCMTITQNVNPNIYQKLPFDILAKIKNYIDAPMTATWFHEKDNKVSKEVITSEIIYYWMINQNIPMECQKWHLNRLLTLIRVCSVKNNPPKKMNRKEMLAQRKALNESRKNQLNSKG